MSIKQLVPEDIILEHSEPETYPGQAEAELEAAFKQHELSHYTPEELMSEAWRQLFEPQLKAMEQLRSTLESFGLTDEQRREKELGLDQKPF